MDGLRHGWKQAIGAERVQQSAARQRITKRTEWIGQREADATRPKSIPELIEHLDARQIEVGHPRGIDDDVCDRIR